MKITLLDIEERVAQIEARNKRVEADKGFDFNRFSGNFKAVVAEKKKELSFLLNKYPSKWYNINLWRSFWGLPSYPSLLRGFC